MLRLWGKSFDNILPRGEERKKLCRDALTIQTSEQSKLRVPVITEIINVKTARVLVNTDCTTTMVHENFTSEKRGKNVVIAFDGHQVQCKHGTHKAGIFRISGKKNFKTALKFLFIFISRKQ